MSDYTSAVRRKNWEKHGEHPSIIDFQGKADCREVFDGSISASSALLTSVTAAFTAEDIGKVCHVAGAGIGPEAIMVDGRVNSQLSTNSYAVMTSAEVSGFDADGASKVDVKFRCSANPVTWYVYGANSADFLGEVGVDGPNAASIDTTYLRTISSPSHRYYRVKIKSTTTDEHGYASIWMAAFGMLLITSIANVIDAGTAQLAGAASVSVIDRKVLIATDNLGALQDALDAMADDAERVLHFPARRAIYSGYYDGAYYVSDTVVYRFQNLTGDGASRSIIRGAPGKDVFYAPDPSLSEAWSIASPFNPFIRDLRIVVDNTVNTTAAFPDRLAYPKHANWAGSTAFEHYDWAENAGNLYCCLDTGTSGSTAPVHSSGVESDGSLRWSYVGPQISCGNFGLAFPQGSAPSGEGNIILRASFERVELWSSTGRANHLGNGGLFTQRPLYSAQFSLVNFHQLHHGYCEAPPNGNFKGYAFVPDLQQWNTGIFSCLRPITWFNGHTGVVNNLQIYASNLDAKSFDLLGYHDLRRLPSHWTFNGLYSEPIRESASRQATVAGYGHRFINWTPRGGHGSYYVQIDATAVVVDSGTLVTDGTNPNLKLYGDQIRIQGMTVFSFSNTIEDKGYGNEAFASLTLIEALKYPRALALNAPYRANWGVKTGQFLRRFSAGGYRSDADLFISALEAQWTPAIATRYLDSTLESNGYVSALSGIYSFAANKESFLISDGGLFPPRLVNVFAKIRGPVGQQCGFYIQVDTEVPPGGVGLVALRSILLGFTGGWQSVSALVDLASYAGKYLIINFDPQSSIDVAWFGIQPAFGHTITQDLSIRDTLYFRAPTFQGELQDWNMANLPGIRSASSGGPEGNLDGGYGMLALDPRSGGPYLWVKTTVWGNLYGWMNLAALYWVLIDANTIATAYTLRLDHANYTANRPLKLNGGDIIITGKIDLGAPDTDVANTLLIGNGGTAATTAGGARTNLDVYSKGEVDALISALQAQIPTGTTEVAVGDHGVHSHLLT